MQRLEETVSIIENRIQSTHLQVLGIDTIPLLMIRWFQVLQTPPALSKRLTEDAKALMRLALTVGHALLRRPPKMEEERNFASGDVTVRHLFAFGFGYHDERHSGVLKKVLAELGPEPRVLGVTDRRDVYEGLSQAKVPCVLLKPPRTSLRPEVLKGRVSWGDRAVLSRGIWLLEAAFGLLDEFKPLSVLTVQDFHFFDQVFASAAVARGITTLTHQHGAIPAGGSLYRHLVSDRIALWGKRSADELSPFLPPERMWVLGTDRFVPLLERPPELPRNQFVIAVNPIRDSVNEGMLKEIFEGFQGAESRGKLDLAVVLRLHPSMGIAEWRQRLDRILAQCNLSMEVTVESGEPLQKARFLASHRSTVSLDAAIAGASVLEMDFPDADAPPPSFFHSLSQSVVPPQELVSEVLRRVNDSEHDRKILEAQAYSLALEIESTKAPQTEARWLRSLELDGTAEE